MTDLADGWAIPANASKFHFFRGVTSICGRWMFVGRDRQPDEGMSEQDCARCRRVLQLEKKGAPQPETPAAQDGANPQ